MAFVLSTIGIARKMPVGASIKESVSGLFNGPKSVSCKMSFQLFIQGKEIPSYTYNFFKLSIHF